MHNWEEKKLPCIQLKKFWGLQTKIFALWDKFNSGDSTPEIAVQETGLLVLWDGAISHNRPQIASDHTIHEKSHNSQKTNSIHKIKHELTIFVGIPVGKWLKKSLPHLIS